MFDIKFGCFVVYKVMRDEQKTSENDDGNGIFHLRDFAVICFRNSEFWANFIVSAFGRRNRPDIFIAGILY